MSVRRKLILLHTAFAAFAVCATAATIYGVQLHVQSALSSLEQFADESNLVDRLIVGARRQIVRLHEIVHHRRDDNASYLAERDAFFTQLTEAASYRGADEDAINRGHLLELAVALRSAFDNCLELASSSRHDEALALLTEKIEGDLLVALEIRLKTAKRTLDQARQSSMDRVWTTNAELLLLAVLIGAVCAVSLAIGAGLVRRWLITPISDLQRATVEFGRGNLAARVRLESNDEFAALASSLNEMASKLDTSQAKYRSLFENLRDAIVICDPAGCIVESRDSDTAVLAIMPDEALGKPLSRIWPNMASPSLDWLRIVADVSERGMHFHASDIALGDPHGETKTVDVLAYPVAYRKVRHVAILVRDVTERHRLQRLAQRAETIKAAETFAHGIAHDFKNLLNSAVTTLSLLEAETTDLKSKHRLHTAFHACRQAAGLARRLLGFAGSDEGRPQVVNLSETVRTILSALDEVFLAPLEIQTHLDPTAKVRIDKDQLTQVVLNLIHNAAEAMPEGGALHVTTETRMSSDPLKHGPPSPHVVLIVRDTGCGMSTGVKEHLFEPLFSTKPRGPHGIRGMGLAVVYSSVRNANGFIQMESEVGAGTTFSVSFPAAHASRKSGTGMRSPVPDERESRSLP